MELVPDYLQEIRTIKCEKELFSVVQLHFQKAIELIRPDLVATVKPLFNDHTQTNEESKVEFDLTSTLMKKCEDFVAVNQACSATLKAELQESIEIRKAQEALV